MPGIRRAALSTSISQPLANSFLIRLSFSEFKIRNFAEVANREMGG
jgi:hypothetical protein